jgi:hypothetical protein
VDICLKNHIPNYARKKSDTISSNL